MMRERTKQKGGMGVGEWGTDSILTEQAGGLAVVLDMSLPSCGTWTKLLQTSVSLSVKMIFGEENIKMWETVWLLAPVNKEKLEAE